MVRKFLLPFLILTSAASFASPEVIQPKTRIIMPLTWYASQAREWMHEVTLHRSNATAWINYFSALRYAQSPAEEMRTALLAMEISIPGTPELKTAQAWNEGFTPRGYQLLRKAYAMDPASPLTYGSLLLFHEVNFNDAERSELSSKMLTSGTVSQSLLSYSYNVLMSVSENSVLFTEGDNASLPLFILQDAMNIRKDVTILNLDLLSAQDYRIRKLNQNGLQFEEDQHGSDLKKRLCAMLPGQNTRRQFYYALSIGGDNIYEIKDHLYVVGLTSQISRERIDNLAVIRENVEKRFLLDHLRVDFNGESEFSAGRILSSNYLVPMLMLNEYYLKNGETVKSDDLKKIVMKLARETGKEQAVMNFLDHESPAGIPFFATVIKTDEVEKTLRVLKDKMYVQNHEVTNGEFNQFLTYLKDNKLNELYDKYKFDLSAYLEPALSMMTNYSLARTNLKKQRFFNDHPAVNMSYEAANAYCDWLTDQYNSLKEKKFKKVKFRLPLINEWQIAAFGDPQFQSWTLDENKVMISMPRDSASELGNGNKVLIPAKDISYPWWGAYNYRNKPQNHRSCWLGNFKIPEGCKPCQIPKTGGDGYLTMAKVSQYFPNNIGLYDVVGNVAEMTSEKGKACGGSWNHLPEESTIRSVNQYSGPDAAVGFRVFMDVIE